MSEANLERDFYFMVTQELRDQVKAILKENPSIEGLIREFKKDHVNMKFTNMGLSDHIKSTLAKYQLGKDYQTIKNIFLSIYRKTPMHIELGFK